MNGFGDRLREERDRLGFSQAVFGSIGGVKANAQGLYERGDRYPDAQYLAAVANRGVDVLYVITGQHCPLSADSLAPQEDSLLRRYRQLSGENQALLGRLFDALLAPGGEK